MTWLFFGHLAAIQERKQDWRPAVAARTFTPALRDRDPVRRAALTALTVRTAASPLGRDATVSSNHRVPSAADRSVNWAAAANHVLGGDTP